MKLNRLWLVVFALISSVAVGGAIKTWTSGNTLTATDLNSNFQHIHNNMVGGHGARLVDADVSATAAVSHSKLAVPALVPKAWAFVGNAVCAASPCAIADSSGISGITRSGAGVYPATITSARTGALYGAWATSNTAALYAVAEVTSATVVTVRCYDAAAVPTDCAFSVVVMDTTN